MPKESDGHLGKLLRATLVGLLSLFCYKDPKVAEEASRRFQQHLKDPADINALPSEYKVSRHSTRTKELQPRTQRSTSRARPTARLDGISFTLCSEAYFFAYLYCRAYWDAPAMTEDESVLNLSSGGCAGHCAQERWGGGVRAGKHTGRVTPHIPEY